MAFIKPVSECLAKYKENKLGLSTLSDYIWNYIFAADRNEFQESDTLKISNN
jgi:hypothetical protein